MSELLSMLVPLNGTLPGWPSHNQFDLMVWLMLMIGLPVVLELVAFAFGWVYALMDKQRGGKLAGGWVRRLPDAAALTALDAKKNRELGA